MTPTWFEHAAFWSGVRRATVAPRSLHAGLWVWIASDSGRAVQTITRYFAEGHWLKARNRQSKHALADICTIQWERESRKKIDRETDHVLARWSSAFPGGLVVRIRRSHRRGRGSIPRLGTSFQVGPNMFESEISLCTFICDMSVSRVKPVVLKLRAPSEDRTHDPWFTRPVLYPLSYGGISQAW